MSGLRPFVSIPKDIREWTRWAKEALIDGSVSTAQIEDAAVTLAKMADLAALSVIGNATGATATPSAIAAAANDRVLSRTAGALSFSQLTAGMFPNTVVPNAALQTTVAIVTGASYTGTLTGCTTAPTATVNYVKVGSLIALTIPTLTAVSNSNACTITGPAPVEIRPASTQQCLCAIQDNSVNAVGRVLIDSAGLITLNATIATAAFTAANNKGSINTTVVYGLS